MVSGTIVHQHLASKLLLGRISDSEKARLNSWLDYIDALQAIDISVAPNITWPYVPSV
nr:tail fiber assembly protein [Cronobacter dublinensis]